MWWGWLWQRVKETEYSSRQSLRLLPLAPATSPALPGCTTGVLKIISPQLVLLSWPQGGSLIFDVRFICLICLLSNPVTLPKTRGEFSRTPEPLRPQKQLLKQFAQQIIYFWLTFQNWSAVTAFQVEHLLLLFCLKFCQLWRTGFVQSKAGSSIRP